MNGFAARDKEDGDALCFGAHLTESPLDFSSHRAALLDRLAPDEGVLIFGAPHHIRNGDSEYRYRPNSDLFWLTGWEEPNTVLFLRPGEEALTLFVPPRDPARETWEGRRHGPEGAKERFGADQAFPIAELETELPRLIQGVRKLHYDFGRDADHDALLVGAIAKASRAARRNGLSVPETFHSLSHLVHELRLHKHPGEIAAMQRAATVSGEAHIAAMGFAAPGRFEFEVESLLLSTFRRNGSSGAGYTPIVAGGDNATILHYITNDSVLADGDLLLIDAGCEHRFYTADITRTFPVGGQFSGPQREVYQHVLEAQLVAIEAARVGEPVTAVHTAAVRRLTEGMVDLGLLEGELDALIEDKAYSKYYMHGTNHWLGLDVHDVGLNGRCGEVRPLEAGMVLTVEPGLYIRSDDEDAPEHLRGIGVRIEDDVLVTSGDPTVLTAAVPKQIDDVEAATRA
jgi:Xaa-Pro aminopeptidase